LQRREGKVRKGKRRERGKKGEDQIWKRGVSREKGKKKKGGGGFLMQYLDTNNS